MITEISEFETVTRDASQYNNFIQKIKGKYSLFEIALNLSWNEQSGIILSFRNLYSLCLDQRDVVSRLTSFPHALICFTFRSFFEEGNGRDWWKVTAEKIDRYCDRNAIRDALVTAWHSVYPNDEWNAYDQRSGIPREVFCSRCWLIKNFQRNRGNSNLCFAIRAFREINDKILRMRPECYSRRGNGANGCESHLRRLLTTQGCEQEREFIADFVDNGATNDNRFGWFQLLDKASRAVVGNLIDVVWDKGVLCFTVNTDYKFMACDEAVDTIKVKLFLRKDPSVTYCFRRHCGGFKLEGATNIKPQPIWKVQSIVKFEYDSVTRREFCRKDILEEKLSGSTLPNGFGVFLVSEDHVNKDVYRPFAHRRLSAGRYSVYAYRRVDGVDFRVIYDKTHVQVNGIPLSEQTRTFEVADENGNVVVETYDNKFDFGINRRSPLREAVNRELCITHKNPQHVFVSTEMWPLPGVDAEAWSYETGGVVAHAIGAEQLYKEGKLTFSCYGVTYEEPSVTFVDFRSRTVFSQFPPLGVGEAKSVTVSGCGAMDGRYEIGTEQTTVSKSLPCGQWKLNIPIVREGLVFRTEDGEEVVSCPFKDGPDIPTREIALEDLKKAVCVSCMATGYERAVITKFGYLDGSEVEVSIPLLKDARGFSFAKNRAYLAERAGVDGDIRMRDLLSDQQKVDWFEVEEKPEPENPAGVRRCRVSLYDPQHLPVIERSLANGLITIRIHAAYCSHAANKVMRWLPSDRMDAANGVKTFTNWRQEFPKYVREPSGRWTATFAAWTMNADTELSSTFSRGAVALAFIGEEGGDLISGGFCLFDAHSAGLTIRGGDWGDRLGMAMHKRYGRNEDDLCPMLRIYSLKWGNCNDYKVVRDLKRGLRSRLTNLRKNIADLGRGADLYMNSLYNARNDQWSGYAYLAGWYFVERAVEEIDASEEGALALNDCMCFHSSTGLRIWHPLMTTVFSIAMADAFKGKNIWKDYCRPGTVPVAEVSDGIAEARDVSPWYWDEIVASLELVDIDLARRGVAAAAQDLEETLARWRALAVFKPGLEEETERQNAADLMDLTQRLRNCLLALESADEQMRATACEQADRPLFCDLVRMIDAKNWN